MRRAIPIVVGIILLLLGIVWGAQGAGVAGSNSYMDSNPTFISLGAVVAVIGVVFIAIGTFWRTKTAPSSTS
ncbi:MAG: hypothetical protein OK438_06555 [Thaumarchaeota archaeon]|nr:hypothetical protein [Nitrososphaerota archaeon]